MSQPQSKLSRRTLFAGGGYQLTEHVKQYYKSTLV